MENINDGTLIIGNKPYIDFPMSDIIDSFQGNIRCNMSLPGYNNGTIFDELALCQHLYNHLVQLGSNLETFQEVYGKEYKTDYIIEFLDRFIEDKSKFNRIFHAEPHTSDYNRKLKSYGCPYTFSKPARTGYVALFDSLIRGDIVYVSHFSIYNEIRFSYYVKKKLCINNDSITHNHCKKDELDILRWLHNEKIIDATLCMLSDTKDAVLKCNGMEPSYTIVSLLENRFGRVTIKK